MCTAILCIGGCWCLHEGAPVRGGVSFVNDSASAAMVAAEAVFPDAGHAPAEA